MSRARTLVGISVFWVGLSMLGDGFTTLVLPLRLTSLADPGILATVVGLITFVGIGAGLLVQPLAGALSDRFVGRSGRRAVLAAGVALIVVALAFFVAAPTLLAILLAFVLVQVAMNIAQAAQQAFIPDLIGERWRGRAAGLKGFADLGGAFLAFLLLASLLGSGSITVATAAIGAIVVLTALLAIVLVREPVGPGRPAERSTRLTFRAAFSINPRDHRQFVTVVLARFLFLLGTFAVGRFFLLLVAARLGLDPAGAADETAGILAILALVTAVGALPAGWLTDRFGRESVMVLGGLASAVGVLLLLVAGSAWQIVVFGSVMAAGSALFATANWAMTTDLVPRDEAARFMGLANFGTAGAAAAAGLVGPIADLLRGVAPSLGYDGILIAAAGAMVLSVVAVRQIATEAGQVHPGTELPAAAAPERATP